MPDLSTSTKPKYRPVYAMLAALYGPDEDVLSTLSEMDPTELERLHRAAAYLADKCESERQDRYEEV